jgi:TolA-binding protein
MGRLSILASADNNPQKLEADMTESSRNEFISKMKDRLDQLDEEIETMKGKGEKMDAEARKEFENRMHDLREKRREAKRKINDLYAASEEKWQQLIDETEHAWKALGNSFNYFKSHFK